MSTGEILMWSALLLLGFIGSALFSGLETGAYRLNRVRLQNRCHEGRRDAHSLANLISKPTVLLSTLLIGNNVMNYLGTASLTVIFDRGLQLNEWQNVVANILIVTPLLFIFCETLPKDLFSAFADRLMYKLAPVLKCARWIFTMTGLVPLISLFTGAIFRLMDDKRASVVFHPRSQVAQLVKEGVGYGVLSAEQSALVERVMAVENLTVRNEMVPWKKVTILRIDDDAQTIWDLAQRTSRSRFPVVNQAGLVVGTLHILDALMYTPETCPPLSQLISPPLEMKASTPLRDAITMLQNSHSGLAILKEKKKTVGIVSMKDLVEAITGELTSW